MSWSVANPTRQKAQRRLFEVHAGGAHCICSSLLSALHNHMLPSTRPAPTDVLPSGGSTLTYIHAQSGAPQQDDSIRYWTWEKVEPSTLITNYSQSLSTPSVSSLDRALEVMH